MSLVALMRIGAAEPGGSGVPEFADEHAATAVTTSVRERSDLTVIDELVGVVPI